MFCSMIKFIAFYNIKYTLYKALEWEIVLCLWWFVSKGSCCVQIENNGGSMTVEVMYDFSCDHEEGDSRLLMHAKTGHKSIVVKTPDTDVIAILVGLEDSIKSKLYVETGKGQSTSIKWHVFFYLTPRTLLLDSIQHANRFLFCLNRFPASNKLLKI